MRSTHHGRKAVVAVLVAVTSLLALAPPSSAVHLNAWLATGHLLSHYDGVTMLVNPNPPPPPVCVPPPDATDATFTIDHVAPGVTHVGVGAIVHAGEQDGAIAGIPVRISLQTVGTGVSAITSGGAVHHQQVHVSLTISNCPGTSVLCSIQSTFTLTGTHNSSDATLSAGETVHVSGVSDPLTVAVGCNPLIRFVVLASTMTLDLTFHML